MIYFLNIVVFVKLGLVCKGLLFMLIFVKVFILFFVKVFDNVVLFLILNEEYFLGVYFIYCFVMMYLENSLEIVLNLFVFIVLFII